DSAPTDYDRQCLLRVMREEQRHGWQMCHVLISNFGESGKLEAQKLLERRAYKNSRLLGAFNRNVDDFIDFLTYTCFIDRDGKYQLNMLHHSSFAPLSRSMGPMLKEEAFHLFTGQTGLSRIVKAGKVPIEILQKYLNKWLSTGYDLFGKDRSGSAARFYRWGFKGRFDEANAKEPPKDLERLNEEARLLYYKEDCEIIESFNRLIPEGKPKLRAPDMKFNRQIGDYAGKLYSVEGNPLTEAEYRAHLSQVLPGPEDQKILAPIFKAGNWMTVTAGNV
ncbi:MAG TPA: Phenylacetic acid catabolic protein, partial [Candidatus Binatia bacterium]|nr:Phenylacetic acid catabolic protein [Candidatus Binatia bacterium]